MLYCFVKEAKAIHGIPDIVGLYRGMFFALEVKRSKQEAAKKTGRIALQRYVMRLIRQCGGFAELIYPDNEAEVLSNLEQHVAKHLPKPEDPPSSQA